MSPVIGVTMGDPAGIGPEIILKLFSGETPVPGRVVVIGDASHLEKTASRLGIEIDVRRVDVIEGGPIPPPVNNTIHVLDLHNVAPTLPLGRDIEEGGRAAAEYISAGVDLALAGRIAAITTCPISKKGLNMAGYQYAGHTEMLAALTGTADFAMMLAGGDIKVVLTTTHRAMKDIARMITKDLLLRIIRLTRKEFKKWFSTEPVIGVAALNPHAGEGGLFGGEEAESIGPAIEEAVHEGIQIEGPYPADSLFSERVRKKFDVIIVMYHDQGLIPIKMAAFGKAVNVTLGLPFIRTSVDHGTAFDIVEKGTADPSSLWEAINLAAVMAGKLTH